MTHSSRVFVSYTTRDGFVTPSLLRTVENNLKEICSPFIHATIPNYNEIGQAVVMKNLLLSHMVILIESPQVNRSPWVRLELLLAKLMLMPIIRLDVSKFSSTIGKS